MEAQDLSKILQRSKNVINRTKNMPYGGYVEKHGTSLLEDGSVVFNSNNSNLVINEEVAKKSKLPIEVINAMRNSASTQSSVLDTIPSSLKEEIAKQTPSKASVQQNTTSMVDYSLIKTIMEDTVKKYIGSLKKSLLSEEKGSGLQLMTKKGNTFRFVTEDGKIFEGQLTYKGNIN